MYGKTNKHTVWNQILQTKIQKLDCKIIFKITFQKSDIKMCTNAQNINNTVHIAFKKITKYVSSDGYEMNISQYVFRNQNRGKFIKR